MDIPMDVTSMSEEELMFYYFRMHDVDLNGKLDGWASNSNISHQLLKLSNLR